MRNHAVLLYVVSAVHASNTFGTKFLSENEKKPGVVTTKSGLQYKRLEDGDGEVHPRPGTDCTCNYEGRTAQEYSKDPKGKKFDSSFDRGSPANFSPSGVIAGWTEAMQMMVEGDKWELYIPSDLGYGDAGQGSDIGGGDVLVFTLHLLKINGESTPAEPRGPPPYALLGEGAEGYVYDAWAAGVAGDGPMAIAVLRQPIQGSKLFQGFKAAARQSAKIADGAAYAITAASRFEKGKYTKDAVADALGLTAPGVFVKTKGGQKWNHCKTGRPTETTVEQISKAVAGCVVAASGAKQEL